MLDARHTARYAQDPMAFLQDRLIDVDGIARKAGDVMDPWQVNDFQDLCPAMLRTTGRSTTDCRNRAWWERGRGHDKTSGIAAVVAYLLTYTSRPLKGYCFAADKDQAGLLKDALQTLTRLNPTLNNVLTIQKDSVVNTATNHPGKGGTLTIFTSDVGSSYGILPDFIVADEITHWQGDGSLWHSIISSAAKRQNCLMLVIANAGFCDSWQWHTREAIRNDPNWIFSRLDGPVASWITEQRLQEQQRLLPAIAYQRLWGNEWSTGGGDALTEADINRAFSTDFAPMTGTEAGYQFCAGVDLGLTRDCAAVVTLAVKTGGQSGIIRLANARLWRPKEQRGGKVQIDDIEKYLLDLDAKFNIQAVGFDPWQAEHMAQRLEALTQHRRRNQRKRYNSLPWMRGLPPTASNLRQMATLAIESFQDGRMRLYFYPPLKNDLHKLRVEEKSYGIRLVSPRDGTGHGDTFSAFANALLISHDMAGKRPVVAGAVNDPFAKKGPAERWAEHIRRREEELAGSTFTGSDPQESREAEQAAMNNMYRTDPFFKPFRRS